MGEFKSAGKTVRYTDADTLRLASDLYQLIDEQYRGSESIDSVRLKEIIQHLHAGMPLSTDEWDILTDIERRNADSLELWRAKGRDGQDAAVPQGSGRIAEALSVLPITMRSRLREAGYQSVSSTDRDKEISIPHLHDSVMHDLAHAKRHAERLTDPDVRGDSESFQFNHEHLMNHLLSGRDHAKRLGKHLEQHSSNPDAFRTERRTLTGLREGRPHPPPHLRQAPPHDVTSGKPARECGSCSMFNSGRCWGYGNIRVDPDWVCDSYELDPGGRDQDQVAHSIMLESSPLPRAVWQLDRVREAEQDTNMMYGELPGESQPGLTPQPTIAVDFDGVIHMGSHGLPGLVEGNVLPGAEDGLKNLSEHYRIVIMTARRDLQAVRVWLKQNKLLQYIADVTNIKPPAAAYIDDRAIHFTSWPEVVKAADPDTALSITTRAKSVPAA